MPVMGFDDERVRDGWVEDEVARAVWLSVTAAPVAGTWAAVNELAMAVVEAVVEALRPLVEVCQAIGEAVLGQVERVWELIGGAGGGAGGQVSRAAALQLSVYAGGAGGPRAGGADEVVDEEVGQ